MHARRHTYSRTVAMEREDSLGIISRLIPPGSEVLELGVATGYFSRFLKENLACRVDGVEIDPAMVEEARSWCRHLVVGDLERERLGDHFPLQFYDVIVCADVLEHLKEPQRVLEQLPLLLKPQGKVVVSVPNIAYGGVILELLSEAFSYRDEGILDKGHMRFFTRDSFAALLDACGFDVERIEPVRFPFIKSEFKGHLEKAPQEVLALIEGRDAYQHVYVAVPKARGGKGAPRVDVIVPVYRGLGQVRRCLESVLAHPQRTPFELVVVNDASPEPELAAYLEERAAAGDITLITRSENGGFADAVNTGMTLHPTRDVLLLNSDTEVHGDWLDRMFQSAYREPKVGTVTPFSNCATLASYPRCCEDNGLPGGMTLAAVDELFRTENAGRSVEIPTGVGFCMYIRRACLDEVGYFDGAAFPRGYGEENDFCMRARARGYRHVLCGDVFVYHEGGGTFGEEKDRLYGRAQEALRHRHPGYERLVAEHVALDPARPLRYRVDAARLRHSRVPKLLFVTHHLGGGTERCVRDMARLLEGHAEVLVLRPQGEDGRVELRWEKAQEDYRLFFDLSRDQDNLVACLKHVGIDRVHIHHLLGYPPFIIRLPHRLGVPYDMTLHDYFAVCPQYNLTRSDGRYCGELGPSACRACLEERPSPWGMDILAWRSLFQGLLEGAERVFAPSRDVIERFKRYIPRAPYVLSPHWEIRDVRVLVLGRLSSFKGFDALIACAADAKRRRLPLRFHLIGSPEEGCSWDPELPLSCHGEYHDPDLQVLIGCARPDAFLFLSQWPETYSYTLSAAMATGLPILAPRMGAFRERLADYPKAHLLDELSPQAINDTLMNMAVDFAGLYRKALMDYLAPVRPSPLAASLWEPGDEHLYGALPKASLESASREALLAHIKALLGKTSEERVFEEDIEAWKKGQEERLRMLEQGMENLHGELLKKEGEIRRLEQRLQEKERQRVALLTSTSWRITAPLRWLVLAYRRRALPGKPSRSPTE